MAKLLEDIIMENGNIIKSGILLKEMGETIEDVLGGDYDEVTHITTKFGFALAYQSDGFVEVYVNTGPGLYNLIFTANGIDDLKSEMKKHKNILKQRR